MTYFDPSHASHASDRIRKITNFQEMRQLLGLTDSEARAVAMTLTFGSQSRWKTEESNETVKKAVPGTDS